jgi:hypothetical protein
VKRLTALASAAAVLLTLTACGSGTSGFPTPATGDPSSTTTASGGGDSTSSQSTTGSGGKIGSADQLSNTQACSLLTASDTAQLAVSSTPNNSAAAGGKSGCEWDGSSSILGVIVRTNVGVAGVNPDGGTVTSTSVGNHHDAAKLVVGTGAGAACMYAIGITSSMRVDVTATSISSASGDPCQEALAAAQIIEPKLP